MPDLGTALCSDRRASRIAEGHQTGLSEEAGASLWVLFVAGALMWGALSYVVPP